MAFVHIAVTLLSSTEAIFQAGGREELAKAARVPSFKDFKMSAYVLLAGSVLVT